MKTRILALFLSLLMAAALAGCSGTTSKSITMADLDGDWIREDNGWPATISSGNMTVIERKEGGSTTSAKKSIYAVEDGVMSLHWEKGKDDYNIVVENGIPTRLEGAYTYVRMERPLIKLGETFKENGIADVTITEIAGFPRLLDTGTYRPIDSGSGMVADDGMLFMEIHYTVKNTYKGELKIPGGVQFTIIYGDGYQFGTEESKYSYYRELEGTGTYVRSGSGGGKGSAMTLASLTEKEYAVYIPVAEVLATDTETPMTINITLESEDSFAYGSVKVR